MSIMPWTLAGLLQSWTNRPKPCACPVAEQLAAKDPNNQAYVNRLLSVLFDTGSNAWFSGDIGKARGLTTREIQIRERSPRTSEDFNLLAQRQQQLAFFEEHMEKAAAAREGKSALENYGRSYAISERTFAESKGQSLADLENMRSLRVGAAFTMELLGQLDAARKSAREALQIADRIVAAQNSAPNHDLQNITRALLFRLMELTGSSDAEFQRFSGNSAALTPQSKQTLIAEGWLQYVTIVWQYPDRTVPAARRAVDGFRAVLRDGGPAQQRIDLARALCSLSYESRSMAHFVPPAEQVTYLEKARLASQEALGILEPLRAAGKLPEVNQDDWAVAKIGLASSESKLAAARGAATVSSR